MNTLRTSLAALLALASCQAVASDIDTYEREVKSRFDPRVRIVEYNPLAIVTIEQALGYATHIQLAPGEEVMDVSSGDSMAWEVAPSGNHVFLKPLELNGRTNISIVTNKRPYQFVVEVVPKEELPDSEMALFVIFVYPDDPKVEASQAAKAKEVQAMQAALREPAPIKNTNYVACAEDTQITPPWVWDDGRFTYMRFAAGQPLPTVEVVLPDGETALPNYRMGGQEGDGEADSHTMVIFETAPKFVIRYGEAESCVINKGIDIEEPQPVGEDTGSTLSRFFRIFRGE